jgi:hypothetical protein
LALAIVRLVLTGAILVRLFFLFLFFLFAFFFRALAFLFWDGVGRSKTRLVQARALRMDRIGVFFFRALVFLFGMRVGGSETRLARDTSLADGSDRRDASLCSACALVTFLFFALRVVFSACAVFWVARVVPARVSTRDD